MKQLIIAIATLAITTTLFSQSTEEPFTSKKNELNVGFVNVFNLSGSQRVGIGYKRYIKKGALRISSINSLTFSNRRKPGHSESNSLRLQPSIGYEWHKYYGRFYAFYGFDLIGTYGKSTTHNQSNFSTNSLKDISQEYELGAAPLVGLRFFINDFISASTETRLNFVYRETASFRIDTSINDEPLDGRNKTYGFSTYFGPVGRVSLNIHF